MPIYRDPDKLKVAIRRDVESLVKRDSLKLAGEVASKIADVGAEIGAETEANIKIIPGQVTLEVEAVVPESNAAGFETGVDNAIKGTFRFGEWSEMRI